MIADTLELYRRFTGEETFQKIIHYDFLIKSLLYFINPNLQLFVIIGLY